MNGIKNHITTPLFQNTYLLMLMRVLSTGFSYLFWVIAARTMPVTQVGIASGSVAVAMLLAGFAHLGLGYGLVRRLSRTENPNGMLNFSLSAAGLTGLSLGTVFLLGVKVWSPELKPLVETFFPFLIFVLLVFALTISRIVFYIFLAARRMVFGLIKQTIQSVLSVILLLILCAVLPGYVGALTAYAFALVISLVFAFIAIPFVQPGYHFSLAARLRDYSSFTKYSLVNYLLEQTQNLPTALLPIIVLNVLGPAASAYFSIPWAIGRGLVSLVGSVSESLFSEGSHEPTRASLYTRRSTQLASFLTLAMLASIALTGPLILSVYGLAYLANSLTLLHLVILAVFPEVLILILVSYLRIRDRLNLVFYVLITSTVLGLTLSVVGMLRQGINGVGLGWLVSQLCVLAFVLVGWTLWRTREPKAPLTAQPR
jgi:O-antigen/teichoic acid export membrane protein